MPDSYMADVSEWQENVDAAAYQKGGYHVLICRTYNGHEPDNKMPGRRDYLRGSGLDGVGWYCYLESGYDPADQARAFIQTIGELRPNEWPILDHEEGSGDQTGRAEAFLKVTDEWAGFPTMIYASESFFDSHLSGPDHWKGRPKWLAGYRNTYSPDPSGEHDYGQVLWQYTDRASIPGIPGGVDCNVTRRSVAEFMSAVRPGGAPQPAPAEHEIGPLVKVDGRIVVFAQRDSGEVLHAYQTEVNGGWAGSEPGTTAKWYSLGNPGK